MSVKSADVPALHTQDEAIPAALDYTQLTITLPETAGLGKSIAPSIF